MHVSYILSFLLSSFTFHSLHCTASYSTAQHMLSVSPHLQTLVRTTLEKCSRLNHLKQLQALIITLGHTNTDILVFKLLRFCTLTLANLDYARTIFNQLDTPNVYLYAAMITAYASSSSSAAFRLYRDMLRHGNPRPNQFIYPHVLKCCSRTDSVHTQILISGFEQYPVVQTALVDAYSRYGGGIEDARKVFDEMSVRSIVSWTAMVSGYSRLGQLWNAVSVFDKMPERDVPSWNALIAGCTQNGLFSEAISLFRRMTNLENARPNMVTLVCLLSACGHSGMLLLGRGIHGYVYRNDIVLDPFMMNALIDLYGKCGNLKEARKIFDMSYVKNLTAWNSMINCCALHGQTDSAIDLFEKMVMSGGGVTPDEVTFVGLLNACTHGGLVEKGRVYFDLMTKVYEIKPEIEHYGCLIDLLGRAGMFEEAIRIIGEMEIQPDEAIWGSLLNSCKIHGRLDLAEFAMKELFRLEPNNGSYGAMLANLYVELGKWDDVHRVRKTLKERNAYKTPGCSWIEVNDQLHQFYSVDGSHTHIDDICKILESLVESKVYVPLGVTL